jgi:hypothetical protein
MSTVIQSPTTIAQPTVAPVAQPTVAPVAQPTVAPVAQPTLLPSTVSTLGLPPVTNPQDDYLNSLLAVDPTSSYTGDSSGWTSGWTSGWSFSSLFSFSWVDLFGYIVRIAILFGLIFLFTTLIPEQELELQTRLLIAGTVVLFYALLDVFRQILAKIKALACSAACGCTS